MNDPAEEHKNQQISIAEEYKLLLQGRRVSSRRTASFVEKKQPELEKTAPQKEHRKNSQKLNI